MKNRTVMHLGLTVVLFGGLAVAPSPVFAREQGGPGCDAIAAELRGATVHMTLQRSLRAVAPKSSNGGLVNNMWGTIVDNNGIVCAVANTGGTGPDITAQWLASRVISAQKANTANGLSLKAGSGGTVDTLSTANLWAATQPGGSLFGLQFSNPVDPAVAYGANDDAGVSQGAEIVVNIPNYGLVNDPLVGKFVGGVNVFGGGLALYDSSGNKLGGVGVSGDTSCADHNVAWRLRDGLSLDIVPSGLGPVTAADNIIYDITGSHNNFQSKGGFGHPTCGFSAAAANPGIVAACPTGDGITASCTAL